MSTSLGDSSHAAFEAQHLAQPGELHGMQDHAGPLLNRIGARRGIAFRALEIARNRNGDPHVVADQFSGVADPADAGIGVL